jgi:hypothetical protein
MDEKNIGFTPSGYNLRVWADNNGITGVSNKKLRELIMIDDWEQIAAFAAPYIMKYGKQGIDYLWDKFVSKMGTY